MQTIDLRKADEIKCDPPTRYSIDLECADGPMCIPGIRRPNPVTVTLTNQRNLYDRCFMAYSKSEQVKLRLPGNIESRGYVTSLRHLASVDGLDQFEVTFMPTGRPLMRPERVYGVPVLAPVMKQIADELARDIARRSPFDTGYLRGSVASGMVIDDPLAPHPMCRSSVVDWYEKTLSTQRRVPVKIRNKFYVASPNVTTLNEQQLDHVHGGNVRLATKPTDRSGYWTRKTIADAIAHGEQMLAEDPSLEHVAIVKIVKVVRRPKPKFIVEDVK